MEAAPIVVNPSGDFLGNDGAWSTLSINVGNPPQALQVLASTQQPATWAVAPAGCQSSDASNCTEARGGAFDATKSSTWFKKEVYQLNEAVNLGYGGDAVNGTYGFDTLELRGTSGATNVSVEHQVVAGITTNKFYLGSLGLAPQVINFSSPADSSPSFLGSLKDKGMIPSLSFGYTAGASYRDDGVNASLTLGGYDASRFIPNDVNFQFAPTQMQQLTIGLQSITYSDSKGEKPLLSEGILALVDSTVPYLWLPQTACEVFESVFGLSWDPIRNLYLINDTAHDTLMEANPSVIFELANSLSGGPSVNISFPYASFDLNASYPITKTQTRYFPLQRAADGDSHTLGRTFFQEAYMIVNHEYSNFSVAQSKFDTNTPSHIVAITANANGSSTTNPTSSGLSRTTGNGSQSISTGAIAGLAIAIAVVGIVAAITAFCCMRRRRHAKESSQQPSDALPPDDLTKVDYPKERDSTCDSEPKKPTVAVTATELPMTPLSEVGGEEYFSPGSPNKPTELPGEHIPRSELSTPDPHMRPELPSSDAQALRSELSTPEPVWPNSELPTPDPSHELPSRSLSTLSSHPSAHGDSDRSALNSPIPRLAQRPLSTRMDSSESEAGFTYDGMRQFHQRFHSDESISSTAKIRPAKQRLDSDESVESPVLGRMNFSSSEAKAESQTVSPVSPYFQPMAIRSLSNSTRPRHQRLGSADSETWETRLDMSSSNDAGPTSRFGTVKHEGRGSGGAIERKPVPKDKVNEGREPKA
ncbi:MAG: hypothetical protein Q9217_003500 [Psora testacea]